MCLFTKDGNSSTNPWDASLSNADWSNLNIFSLTNTYWAPCQQTPAAPVSGSSTAAAASTGMPDPLKSNAVIRSPESFVTATGSATQVGGGCTVTGQRQCYGTCIRAQLPLYVYKFVLGCTLL
jgi:hypothetical protein